MSKIKRTFRELEQLHIVCQEYLSKVGDQSTLLSVEIERFVRKQLIPLMEEYQEEVYLNQVKAAHKDEKGILQKNADGSFQFTEEGEMCRVRLNRALRQENRELHCRFINPVPKDLTSEEVEVFAGIFWPSESEE
jgi:hypothetical protein